MSGADLVYIDSKRAGEIGKIGGKSKSDKKLLAINVTSSKKAMCKNCKAVCVFKNSNIRAKATKRCTVPEARAKAMWFNKPVWSKEVIEKLTHETILSMVRDTKSAKDKRMLHAMLMSQANWEFPVDKSIKIDNRKVTVNYLTDEVKEQMIKDLLSN